MTPRALYFDDLQLGDKFVSERQRVTAEDIKRFAAEFDPQPFHLDESTARDTIFAGLAASGWHTAAVTMRLLVTSGLPLANGIIGVGGSIEWKAPTRPGDELHVESEVIELTPSHSKPDRGMAVIRATTLNDRGQAVQGLMAKLLVLRRPRPDA